MSARLIRDCTLSEKVNALSVNAERFLYRLFMKVDDFGRYYFDPRILKAQLFPLQLDQIREADITRWTAECEKAGLIVLYESSGKQYLEVLNFGQRLRSKKSQFPEPVGGSPPTVVSNVRTIVSNPPTNDGNVRTSVGLKRREVEVEEEVEEEERRARADLTFEKFLEQIGEQYLEILSMNHKGKDIRGAAREAFSHLVADKKRVERATAADFRKLLNSWLSNIKPAKNGLQKAIDRSGEISAIVAAKYGAQGDSGGQPD